MNVVWQDDLKKDARTVLGKIPFPTRKDENYRFTAFKDWAPGTLSESRGAQGEVTPAPWDEAEECAMGALTSLGKFTAHGRLPEGVVFGPLSQLSEEKKSQLAVPERLQSDYFAQWVAANWKEGIYLRVPKGMKIEKPIRGVHQLLMGAHEFFPRVTLILEEGAEATYVDEFTGHGGSAQCGALVSVVVGPGAKLHYVQVQNWGEDTAYFVRQQMDVQADGQLHFVEVSMGGKKGQVRTETRCLGAGAEIHVKGVARGQDSQEFDFWFSAFHDVPDTRSYLDYWTVVADRSRAVFNGNLVITERGVRTDAYQKNRNMVLSKKATVDTLPKLEIATDEVKCAHGATISPVDENQIFYLQSRGIERQEAILMVINGFSEPVTRLLPTEQLRKRVSETLTQKHAVGGER